MDSSAASLMVWTGCGLLVLLGTVCYADMGTGSQVQGQGGVLCLHLAHPWLPTCSSGHLHIGPNNLLSLSFAKYALAPSPWLTLPVPRSGRVRALGKNASPPG